METSIYLETGVGSTENMVGVKKLLRLQLDTRLFLLISDNIMARLT
jgi:hypothetical protein